MHVYEVLQVEAKTGRVEATLPVTDISYTDTRNAAGSATVGMPLDAADPDRLVPGRSALVVLCDGEPVWGGLLWTATADLAAGTLSLNASGWHSYYAGRVLHEGYNRTADQGWLVRDWIDACNDEGGIGTDTSSLLVQGTLVSREWTRYELKTVADAIAELAEDARGFVFRYETFWQDASHIGHRIVKFTNGEAQHAPPFTLTHGVNCDVTQVSYDATAMATRVYAVGADNGDGSKLVGIATNDLTLPAKDVVQTFSDVKSTPALMEKAQALASVGRAPIAIPTLTLYPDLFGPTDCMPGDSGMVQVDSGYVRVLDEFVVTERKTDVDANGVALTGLSLANKGVFENGS